MQVRAADFAAVAVYIRPVMGERPPHHLLPVQQFLDTAGRAFPAGEDHDYHPVDNSGDYMKEILDLGGIRCFSSYEIVLESRGNSKRIC